MHLKDEFMTSTFQQKAYTMVKFTIKSVMITMK